MALALVLATLIGTLLLLIGLTLWRRRLLCLRWVLSWRALVITPAERIERVDAVKTCPSPEVVAF